MRPSPPMPDEIKASFYPEFERGWRTAELVGRAVMLLAVAATLGGLLGGGPRSLWTRHTSAGPLRIEYAPVVRFGTPTGVTIRAAAEPNGAKVAVTLPANIVQEYGLQTVFPQPAEWKTGEHGDIRITLPVQPGAHEAVAQLGGMPAVEGLLHFWARLGDDGPTVRWSQIVLP